VITAGTSKVKGEGRLYDPSAGVRGPSVVI
jgi:hypothetical protein